MKKLLLIIIVLFCFLVGMANAQMKVSITGADEVKKVDDLSIKLKLPFDEEYKIRLENTDNSRRCLINIRIDGRRVTGSGLIMRTSETVELERFLDAGSLTKGKKFKFIPKSDEPLRPGNAEDGLIIISVQYEKAKKPLIEYAEPSRKYSSFEPQWQGFVTVSGDPTITMSSQSLNLTTSTAYSETGITVEGSESTQRFQKEEVGALEDRIDTLKIELVGYYKKPPILMKK